MEEPSMANEDESKVANSNTGEIWGSETVDTIAGSNQTLVEDGIHSAVATEHTDSLPGNSAGNITICLQPEPRPSIYNIGADIACVSPLMMPSKLPEVFAPIIHFCKTKEEDDVKSKLRSFVGGNLSDEQFTKLADYCSPSHLRQQTDLVMSTSQPQPGHRQDTQASRTELWDQHARAGDQQLVTLQRLRLRMTRDPINSYAGLLKYVSCKIMPPENFSRDECEDPLLVPGQDILYSFRVYVPFKPRRKSRFPMVLSRRWPRFYREIVVPGSAPLTELRDHLACINDVGLRNDISDNLDREDLADAKDVFPSGFLFINNVFYNDMRQPNAVDLSASIREWAVKRGLGRFPHKDMHSTRLDTLQLRLGHPEVYVHQGSCEHLLTVSEVRLLGADDCPAPRSVVRASCALHSVYCLACSAYTTRWLVTQCERIPFDPAFLCDACLRLYLYRGQQKVCHFRAYRYTPTDVV